MSFGDKVVWAAQKHARENRTEIGLSTLCGCFSWSETFAPAAVERWLQEGAGTAICPECQVDAVIGDASGYPVGDPSFLPEMHQLWFERVIPIDELPLQELGLHRRRTVADRLTDWFSPRKMLRVKNH